MTARRRRWSFSLQTIFVLLTLAALPLGWFGYQLNWIRERRHAEREPGVAVLRGDTYYLPYSAIKNDVDPPFPLGWFGEAGAGEVVLDARASSDRDRFAKLFPEARIRTN